MSKHSLAQQFSQLYDEYADPLFRHIYLRISDRNRALDLTQETFMRAWRYAIKEGNEILQPRAFLYRVANNLVINEYERRRPTVSADDLMETGELQPVTDESQKAESRLDAELAAEVLAKLNESYRQVVVMRYVDGLSIKEIARVLDESENNVSVRIHRGVKTLRRYLRDHYDL